MSHGIFVFRNNKSNIYVILKSTSKIIFFSIFHSFFLQFHPISQNCPESFVQHKHNCVCVSCPFVYMCWYVTVCCGVSERERPGEQRQTARDGEALRSLWVDIHSRKAPLSSLLHVWTSKDTDSMLLLFDLTCAVFLIRTTLGSETVFGYRPTVNTTSKSWLHTVGLLWNSRHGGCCCVSTMEAKPPSPVGREKWRSSQSTVAPADFTSAMTLLSSSKSSSQRKQTYWLNVGAVKNDPYWHLMLDGAF